MTEETSTPSETSKGNRGPTGKIRNFIRKNKTLSAVVGLGALYFSYKEIKKNQGESVVEGEVTGEGAASGEGPLLPNEISNEAADEEVTRVQEEREAERSKREEEQEFEAEAREAERDEYETSRERAREEGEATAERNDDREEGTNNGTGSTESPIESPPQEISTSQGLTIHNHFFSGATKSTIVGSGESEGGKKYIEYLIQFPSKTEHWRYYTATGNWGQASNSATNPASSGAKTNSAIGNAQVAEPAPPSNNANHPNAVNTGNRCENGGVGPHTAPSGYHLFCENGWIWRAPDEVKTVEKNVDGGMIIPAGSAASNAHEAGEAAAKQQSGGGGGNTSCPAGTVQNIQQNRNEVTRLTGEIQQLKSNVQQHPNAKQRGEWETNIRNKEQKRNECQGAVDRGRQQPGCGNV